MISSLSNENKNNSLGVKYMFILMYLLTVSIFELIIFFEPTVTLNTLSFFAVLFLIMSMFINAKIDNNFLTLSNIFLFFSFIFHLSHVVLIQLGYENVLGYDMRVYTSEYYYNAAVVFSIQVHIFLFIGILLSKIKLIHGAKLEKNKLNETIELNAVFYTGLVLFIIGLIPKLYIDIQKIILFVHGDYLATTTISVSGILLLLSGFANSGVILMIIGKQKDSFFCRNLVIFSLVYNILYMITGSRGDSVIVILMTIYIYYTVVKKIEVKNYILTGLFGYLFIVVITFVAETRHVQDKTFSFMISSFVDSLINKSPIALAIAEFGVTIKTVFYSLENFPLMADHSYGMNYLNSVFVILPNFNGYVKELIDKLTYIFYFPNHTIMGGSYIGEMYYAAGKYGVIFALMFGFVLGKLSSLHVTSQDTKKWIYFSITSIIFLNFMWWIRDYFYVMVREIFWTTLIIYFLYSFFNKKMKLNKA